MSTAESSNEQDITTPTSPTPVKPLKHVKRLGRATPPFLLLLTFPFSRQSFSARVVIPEAEGDQDEDSDGEEAEESSEPVAEADFLEGFPEETEVRSIILLLSLSVSTPLTLVCT